MIRSGRARGTAVGLVLVLVSLGLVGCGDFSVLGLGSSGSDRSAVISREEVTNAEYLKEGRDYEVVATVPAHAGVRDLVVDGLVGKSEAFGVVRTPRNLPGVLPSTVSLIDAKSGRATAIAALPAGTYVVGMDFSARHIVWTEDVPFGTDGTWRLRSYDRRSKDVRTLAAADDSRTPWLPYGIPYLHGDTVYLLVADSHRLPTPWSAYRVAADGSSGFTKVTTGIEGVFPFGDDLALMRHGRFVIRDARSGKERRVDLPGAKGCGGTSNEEVIVRCDRANGRQRLTILARGKTTRIHFPKPRFESMSYGVGDLSCSASWVGFTFNDQAYLLNLKSGKLGKLKGAMYVEGGPSIGEAIHYAPVRKSPGDFEPSPFIRLVS